MPIDRDWQALALWLADCHAATAEYDGSLKSTSKSRRERLKSISARALRAIETGRLAANVRKPEDIIARLRMIADAD